MHRLLVFLALLILPCSLNSCVKYEEEEQSNKDLPPLEALRLELENSPRKKQFVQDKNEVDPKAPKKGSALPDPQKTLAADVYNSQARAEWPPTVGRPFPDMLFLTPSAQKRSLREFKGRTILVEYIHMKSPSSQAFSGSAEHGPLGNVQVRRDFQSLEKYFPAYTDGVRAGEIAFVQILLRDTRGSPVSIDAAQAWAKHFSVESRGRTILIGSPALLQKGADEMAGGFQLIDKNQVVRADATGENSKSLFSSLFPQIKRYVRAR